MSEATVFRSYAEEAMWEASKTKRDDEKQALQDLACIWARAALVSDKLFGSNPTLLPRGDGEATPLIHS